MDTKELTTLAEIDEHIDAREFYEEINSGKFFGPYAEEYNTSIELMHEYWEMCHNAFGDTSGQLSNRDIRFPVDENEWLLEGI